MEGHINAMRRIIQIPTFILISSFLMIVEGKSQKFVEEDKIWTYVDTINTNGSIRIVTSSYKFGEDVEIDGTVYKEILRTRDPAQTNDWIRTRGRIREDVDGKVYVRMGTIESLLFDFSLEVGDTTGGEINASICYLTVYDVDTISLPSGELRRRLHLRTLSSKSTNTRNRWIEGIGSNRSFSEYYESDHCYSDQPRLACVTKNSRVEYNSNDFSSCIVTNGTELQVDKITIWPNPTEGIINLNSDTEVESLEVLTADALVSLERSNDTSIDLSQLPDGIYFLKVLFTNGGTAILKVSKI